MFMSWPYGARSEQQYEVNIFMGINIENNFLKNHSWTCDSCKRSGPWASCFWKEDGHYGDVLFFICSCSCNVTPVENCNIMPFSPTVNWCNVNMKNERQYPIKQKFHIVTGENLFSVHYGIIPQTFALFWSTEYAAFSLINSKTNKILFQLWFLKWMCCSIGKKNICKNEKKCTI